MITTNTGPNSGPIADRGSLPSCREATVQVFTTPDGKAWELFIAGENHFLNQIPGPDSPSQSSPGQVMRDRGMCNPAPQQLIDETTLVASVNPLQDNLARWQIARHSEPPAMGGDGIGWLIVVAAGIAAITRGQALLDRRAAATVETQIAADVRSLVAAGGGAVTPGIPPEFAPEPAGNSREFDRNSGGIPAPEWPPKSMGVPYDPTAPEQPGEFDSYRRAIENDGLSPRGNDVIKALWGATPGRSEAYQKARHRRDQFAKRLDYYRFEEM